LISKSARPAPSGGRFALRPLHLRELDFVVTISFLTLANVIGGAGAAER
jgi:hypothetical protein